MQDARWEWYRVKELRVDAGMIILEERGEAYNPFDYPNLPNAFAKVDNETSAVAFIKKYGGLGFIQLFDDFYDSEMPPIYEQYAAKYQEDITAEPLKWILLHAATIRFVLRLIELLQDHKEKDLQSLIENETIAVPENNLREGYSIKRNPAHFFARRGGQEMHFYYPNDYKSHKAWAIEKIQYLVNVNTERVRRQLHANLNHLELMPVLWSDSLISAIWYQVGEIALLSREQKGKAIRTCKECGLPFLVTDKRQQFCPGDDLSAGSLCGAKYRMRKKRKGE